MVKCGRLNPVDVIVRTRTLEELHSKCKDQCECPEVDDFASIFKNLKRKLKRAQAKLGK